MAIMNWWLSGPLFFSGVYRSHVEVDLSSLRFPQDDKDRLILPTPRDSSMEKMNEGINSI
jgi:hypothetical protein